MGTQAEEAAARSPHPSLLTRIMTAKDKLPPMMPSTAAQSFTARESWRIIGIMAEFVEGTERLRPIRPAVSIFGSARTPPDHMYYILTEQIAHFFQHYKDLEKGKSVEIVRWADPEETGELIRQGIERANAAGKGQPGT